MPKADSWDHSTRPVRIFPDRAETVIWFEGPFHYPETCLSAALIQRMEAWEARYYAALTEDLTWRSVEESERLDAQGMELAHELEVEIGPDFDVEYRSFAGQKMNTPRRGHRPASNPAAEEAFLVRAEAHREERARIQALRSAGATLGWTG